MKFTPYGHRNDSNRFFSFSEISPLWLIVLLSPVWQNRESTRNLQKILFSFSCLLFVRLNVFYSWAWDEKCLSS
jgi:hypothetical protein